MPDFYYIDDQKKPAGPVPMETLRTLRGGGTISDATLIAEVGASTWTSLGEYRPSPPPVPGAQQSPHASQRPPLSSDEAHQRAAAAAAQASAKMEASAALLKDSVMSTVRAAASPGEKLALYGAAAALVAFFLPWMSSAFGGSASGFKLASSVQLLYVLPMSLIAACFLAYLNIRADRHSRILRARWFMGIGTFWLAISLVAVTAGRSLLGVAAIGLYLTVLGTAALAAGGFLQIGEQVARPAD